MMMTLKKRIQCIVATSFEIGGSIVNEQSRLYNGPYDVGRVDIHVHFLPLYTLYMHVCSQI